MSMTFDRFPNRASADRFVRKVKEDYGLRSVVSDSIREKEKAAAESKGPFFVHIERARDALKYVKDKDAIKTAAKKWKQEHPSISADVCIKTAIERALWDLAKKFGGKFHCGFI